MAKLDWVENFITKELYAPYVVAWDEDYYKDLNAKYKLLYDTAKMAGADAYSAKPAQPFQWNGALFRFNLNVVQID